MFEIAEPIIRSKLRQFWGREFYIAKRKFDCFLGNKKWATLREPLMKRHLKFKHRSVILRPLKDVEMYLQENKRKNLEIAIAKIDQIIIRPGETFSFWRLVGRPTKKKGYLDGLVLNQGTIAKGTGGGLCQLGNLLFWMAAHSPLTIVERWRHGFDVFPDVNRTIPFGAGATLSYNYIDFQVTNNTSFAFAIHLWLDETYLNGALYCEEDYPMSYSVIERNHQIKQQIWGGYSRHNQIYQIESSSDGYVSEKLLAENHAIMMYEPLLEAAK